MKDREKGLLVTTAFVVGLTGVACRPDPQPEVTPVPTVPPTVIPRTPETTPTAVPTETPKYVKFAQSVTNHLEASRFYYQDARNNYKVEDLTFQQLLGRLRMTYEVLPVENPERVKVSTKDGVKTRSAPFAGVSSDIISYPALQYGQEITVAAKLKITKQDGEEQVWGVRYDSPWIEKDGWRAQPVFLFNAMSITKEGQKEELISHVGSR